MSRSKPIVSVIMPARNEMFLQRTIDSVLATAAAEVEVIAILDGYWPESGILDHPQVVLVHHEESIGQRAACNEGVRLARGQFIMKLDAHCHLDRGWDVKLAAECDYDWTVIPQQKNLHAFDWVCGKCGHRTYQGPTPPHCAACGQPSPVRDMIWQPRPGTSTNTWGFTTEPKFFYWRELDKRQKGKIINTMSCLGACFFMHRQRYLDLGGNDEAHGSWGQQGIEMGCKSWLSGGRMVTNKKTWFAHMFRTQGGDFGFPYDLGGRQVDKARKHSRNLWFENAWPGQKRPLSWLIEHLAPIPDWHEDKGRAVLERIMAAGEKFQRTRRAA